MVIPAGEAEKDQQKRKKSPENSMDMVPEKSTNLNNFSSLPCFNVKWGRQKQLRCVKLTATTTDQYYPASSSSPPPDFTTTDTGIEAVREKLMLDFRTQVNQMHASYLGKKTNGGEIVSSSSEARPWNLRTRRAVCKDPTNGHNNNNVGGVDRKPNFSPARQSEIKSPVRRTNQVNEQVSRAKFTPSLSKQEIEDDFLAISGNRPARRPKKRSKFVQKQIDGLFPGFWLSEITADMYKVNENPETGKR